MSDELEVVKLQIDAWKTTVEVQKHFNDIEMRIRALFLTLVGVLLTVSAAFSEHMNQAASSAVVTSAATSYTMTIVLTLCCIFALLFWYMDRFWYHVYLRGAVKTGEDLEKLIARAVPGVDLTQAISKSSHGKQLWRRRTTGNRLLLFYGAIAYICGAGAILSRFPSPWAWSPILIIGIIALLGWTFGRDSA